MTSIMDYLQIPLIQNMFMATILACILCGVVGTYVVSNRMVSVTGGIAHTTFGGVGFAYYVMSVFMVSWMTPQIGAMIFAIIAALIMVACKKVADLRNDTTIGVLWAVGMALGVVFMCFMDRSVIIPASYESILFGNVLFVSSSTLQMMLVLTVLILAVVVFLFRDLQILTFDEIHAHISGINITVLDIILHVIIAVTCVMVANVVGIVMIIALMTMPAALANLFTHDMNEMMVTGAVLSVLLSVTGLFISLTYDLPPGAAVVLVVGLAFMIGLLAKRTLRIGTVV